MISHIAVIPARQGSAGVPGKNRMFLDRTADFLATIPWFSRIIVSTDDDVVKQKALAWGYEVRDRPAHLAGPAVSIKAIFEDLIATMSIRSEEILWLFYVPLLYRRRADFEAARQAIESPGTQSVCSFVPAETHPYNCWRYDADRGLEQYVPNDVFRRQDLPSAWMTYHYTCCFKAAALPSLNAELVGRGTRPLFLDAETTANLIEIDTLEDLERWQKLQARSSEHE